MVASPALIIQKSTAKESVDSTSGLIKWFRWNHGQKKWSAIGFSIEPIKELGLAESVRTIKNGLGRLIIIVLFFVINVFVHHNIVEQFPLILSPPMLVI